MKKTKQSELATNDRAQIIAMLALTGRIDQLSEQEIEAIAYKPESEWPDGLAKKVFP